VHGFGPVDEARLAETVAARLEASLRQSPEGICTADAQLVEAERLAAAQPRGPALAALVATSLDGALRS
jgi:hypothetical protein